MDMTLNLCRVKSLVLVCILSGLVSTIGCAAQPRHYFVDHPVDPNEVIFVTSTPTAERARELRMFAAHGMAPVSAINWDHLLQAISWADIIIIGEQHDDAIGHAVQRAVVEDVVRRWRDSALTMEMLERDDQRIIDDYAEGLIDADWGVAEAILSNRDRANPRRGDIAPQWRPHFSLRT